VVRRAGEVVGSGWPPGHASRDVVRVAARRNMQTRVVKIGGGRFRRLMQPESARRRRVQLSSSGPRAAGRCWSAPCGGPWPIVTAVSAATRSISSRPPLERTRDGRDAMGAERPSRAAPSDGAEAPAARPRKERRAKNGNHRHLLCLHVKKGVNRSVAGEGETVVLTSLRNADSMPGEPKGHSRTAMPATAGRGAAVVDGLSRNMTFDHVSRQGGGVGGRQIPPELPGLTLISSSIFHHVINHA